MLYQVIHRVHCLVSERSHKLVVCKAAFTSECEQNSNAKAAFENLVNVRCRRVTEARQTAFGCATNIWQTDKCYPSTVGTSKGIHMQYVYVGSICCLGKS